MQSARTLEQSFDALRTLQPPPGLAPAVLHQLDLGYRYATLDTVLGRVFVAYSGAGVIAIQRDDDAQAFEEWFGRRFGRTLRREAALPPQLSRQLAAALRAKKPKASLDLSFLRPFERSVLLKTLEIPRGEVRTYSWVAKEIGRPHAVRAVGTALATNPIPLVIPCHRVVRSDGRIGEYGCGGPEAKRLVLEVEGANPQRLEQLGRRGVRLIGSDTTHAFCLPACVWVKRITDRHRVMFRSEAEAVSAGYHPCNVCRPSGAAA